MDKDQILKELPYLERAALKAVHAMAAHLLGATAPQQAGAGTLAQTVFDALAATLGASVAYSGFAATRTHKQFINRLDELVKTLDRHFTGWDRNKVAQIAFLRFLFGLLLSDLKTRGVAPTFGIMIVNLGRIQAVIEGAFPGYLEAGHGPVIYQRVSGASIVC